MSLLYHLYGFVLNVLEIPFWWFREAVLKMSCKGHIDGIAICDVSIDSQPSDLIFLHATQEAMALIQSLDSRRYRRFRKHFKYIVNLPMISGGDFEQKRKICNVDYSRYVAIGNSHWSLRHYACLLVHESTDGVIFKKGFLYDKKRRERIERLCHLEEYRFAQRLEPGWAEVNIGAFNPDGRKLYWGPRQNRLMASWKRLREAFAAAFKQAK